MRIWTELNDEQKQQKFKEFVDQLSIVLHNDLTELNDKFHIVQDSHENPAVANIYGNVDQGLTVGFWVFLYSKDIVLVDPKSAGPAAGETVH